LVFTAILFFIAAIGAITGAIGVVMLRNPFYSVLAGAVMVLYVFVVAYVGGGEQLTSGGVLRVLGPLFALALAIELCIAMLGAGLKGVSSKGAPFVPGFGSPAHIGRLFLTTYLYPFEIASILLLAAAVGAVVLARRRRGLEPDEEMGLRVSAPRPAYTGTMAEGAGIRPTGGDEPLAPEVSPVGTSGAERSGSRHEGGW
jgi:NADH-quinone oxidoreductase subunit J